MEGMVVPMSSRQLLSNIQLSVLLLLLLTTLLLPTAASTATPALPVLVQAASAEAAAAAVARHGGVIRHQLAIIDGVAATVSPAQLARLEATTGLVVRRDAPVRASNGPRETDTTGFTLYPAAATGVHTLHEQQVRGPKAECKDRQVRVGAEQEQRELQGWGVTVAVVDSGMLPMASGGDWSQRQSDGTLIAENSGRCLVYRDFLPRTTQNANSGPRARNSVDQHGHGTHVLGTIADNREEPLAAGMNATPIGVAPQANLLVARALDQSGAGSYGDVIAAIDWIVANRARYNVRVLNLSLYAPVQGPYWDDPLNQAVMRAWQAGVVVVAAAGNLGPGPNTITVPGNVPYVVTVGALRSGRYNASGDDELADYSSRGPTEMGFVKPDLLVPGSRTIAPMPQSSTLATSAPDERTVAVATVDLKIGAFAGRQEYGQLSGTSMAAAQVSGVVALMLQANPGLTNDEVKGRLLATARPASDPDTGQLRYSVWEQGAGLLDARAAILGTTTERANQGMEIAKDLAGIEHYQGFSVHDELTGEYRLVDPTTGELISVWSGGRSIWSGGRSIWSGGRSIWSGGRSIWSGGRSIWSGGRSIWSGAQGPTVPHVATVYEP
jgi:serine protease AprX